jgi:hypothetical protein
MNDQPHATTHTDTLARICDDTRAEVARRKQAVPLDALRGRAASAAR